MQASLSFSTKLPLTPTTHLPTVPKQSLLPERAAFAPRIRAIAASAPDTSTVDYSSPASVFPAEACETLGGDACAAEMYPEAKLKPAAAAPEARTSSEKVDREYIEYNEPKTVFPGEACDDLGGEFCEPEYQKGVY
ncbi:hypothetical protein ACLOJK_002217 [Asimina triloba]